MHTLFVYKSPDGMSQLLLKLNEKTGETFVLVGAFMRKDEAYWLKIETAK